MQHPSPLHLAILYPGDQTVRREATPENNRFADLFSAFAAAGVQAEPAVYHDAFAADVRRQLLARDGVLAWSNPVEGGRDRSVLDAPAQPCPSPSPFPRSVRSQSPDVR